MTQEKRRINAKSWLQTHLPEPDKNSRHDLHVTTLELLLKTYGKELLLEAAERVWMKSNGDIYDIIPMIDEL